MHKQGRTVLLILSESPSWQNHFGVLDIIGVIGYSITGIICMMGIIIGILNIIWIITIITIIGIMGIVGCQGW